MPVTLGAKPEHGFDEPLGLLNDCHRRIEHFLDVLLRVAEDARGQALAPPQRDALEVGLRYFREAAPRHTDDEEHSLFPRMRASNDPRIRDAMVKLQVLEADHRQANVAHDAVELLGMKWLKQGALDSADADRIGRLLVALREMYRRHIDVEDQDVLPLAAQILKPEEIALIGFEMARRRGLERLAAR